MNNFLTLRNRIPPPHQIVKMKISRVKALRYNGGWKVAKRYQHSRSRNVSGSSSSPSNKKPLGLHGNNNQNNSNNNPEIKRKKKRGNYTRDAQELASGKDFCEAPRGRLDGARIVFVSVRESLAWPGTLTWVIIGRQDVVNLYVPSQVAEEFRFFLVEEEGKRNRKKGLRDGLMRNC